MKNYKEFKVTPEILDLFRDKPVSSNNVKKLIPNYMEYQRQEYKRSNARYLEGVSDKIAKYLCESHITTAQRFLDGIQFILESEGLLRKDNTREIFHFDGINFDNGYGYVIYETVEKLHVESEKELLARLVSEIRVAEKKEKEEQLIEQQNIKITNEMLTKIANDPVLMHQLLNLKGN